MASAPFVTFALIIVWGMEVIVSISGCVWGAFCLKMLSWAR